MIKLYVIKYIKYNSWVRYNIRIIRIRMVKIWKI
jgi:hypothetical protein